MMPLSENDPEVVLIYQIKKRVLMSIRPKESPASCHFSFALLSVPDEDAMMRAPFCPGGTVNSFTIPGSTLHNALSGLDLTCPCDIQLHIAPPSKCFLTEESPSGAATMNFTKAVEYEPEFTQTQICTYKAPQMKALIKALQIAGKVTISTDNKGLMSVHISLLCQNILLSHIYNTFHLLPYIDENDDMAPPSHH
ncbi:hypothetical protein Pelo_9328 [Pelomyxa schiedti]|nr:hypothetical protein Pelo_9328 [Pelomyxa schiedti]